MLVFSAIFSLLIPTLPPPTVPVDSVKVEFTFERMEPGTISSPKTSYFYHLSIENTTNEMVYVLIPRWFETKPLASGVMKSCDNDSHDGIIEYSFYTEPSFEVYAVKPHSTITDDQCKVRSKNEAIGKMSRMDLSVMMAHDIKIGELKLDEYMGHKDFFGNNLTYQLVDVGSENLVVSLK